LILKYYINVFAFALKFFDLLFSLFRRRIMLVVFSLFLLNMLYELSSITS